MTTQRALEAAETALRVGEDAISVTTTFSAMLFDGSDGTDGITSDSSHSVDPTDLGNYGPVCRRMC